MNRDEWNLAFVTNFDVGSSQYGEQCNWLAFVLQSSTLWVAFQSWILYRPISIKRNIQIVGLLTCRLLPRKLQCQPWFSLAMSKGNKKRLRQEGADASSDDRLLQVLLLGEANFSFALALRSMLEPPTVPAAAEAAEVRREIYQQRLTSVADYFGMSPQPDLQLNITATCYESHVELEEKYPETVGILSRLWHFAVDISWNLRLVFEKPVLACFSSVGVSLSMCFKPDWSEPTFVPLLWAQQVTWATPP